MLGVENLALVYSKYEARYRTLGVLGIGVKGLQEVLKFS